MDAYDELKRYINTTGAVQSTTESDNGSISASSDDYVPDATKIPSSLQLPHDTHKSQGKLLLDLIEESLGKELRQEIEKFARDARSDKERNPRCEPAQQLVEDLNRAFNKEADEEGNKGPNEDPNKEAEEDLIKKSTTRQRGTTGPHMTQRLTSFGRGLSMRLGHCKENLTGRLCVNLPGLYEPF